MNYHARFCNGCREYVCVEDFEDKNVCKKCMNLTMKDTDKDGRYMYERNKSKHWRWAKDKLMQKQKGKCNMCKGSFENLQVDHIWPISRQKDYNGDINAEENLQLLCRSCNLKKGSKLPFDPALKSPNLTI